MDAFEARFGVPILEGYGMTETAATITFNVSPEDRRAYSVGRPVWGVEVQVWDEAGRRMPPGRGHVGEVVTRGYHTMRGYHGQPEATAEAFGEGWFRTGALGYFDSDLPLSGAGKVLKKSPAGGPFGPDPGGGRAEG
jgi:long-chain acyl-CoA synthetase